MKPLHLIATCAIAAGLLAPLAWFTLKKENPTPSATIDAPNPVESATQPSSVTPSGSVTFTKPATEEAASTPLEAAKKSPPQTRAWSLLGSTDQEQQLEGLRLALDLADSDAKWEHLDRALQSSLPRTRVAAVELAVETGGENLGEFLNRAVVDVDSNVGLAALFAAESQSAEVRQAVQESALHSGNPEVGSSAIGQLEIEGNAAALEILFAGLDSSVGETRADTQTTLELMFDQTFENSAEAKSWWKSNQQRFDANLVQIAD